MLIEQRCPCPLTLLQDLQVLPENITGEWWRNGQEAVSSQRDHLPSLQVVEWTKVETLQRELFDSPLQPTQYVLLSPLARIWNGKEKCISLSCSLKMQYSKLAIMWVMLITKRRLLCFLLPKSCILLSNSRNIKFPTVSMDTFLSLWLCVIAYLEHNILYFMFTASLYGTQQKQIQESAPTWNFVQLSLIQSYFPRILYYHSDSSSK